MKHTLLVELLTEELPPKALGKLGDAFATAMFNGLSSRALLDEGARFTAYASPRRLAVSIQGVRGSSPDKQIREKVLPVSVALDKEGQPAAPLTKKLAALAAQAGRESIALSELLLHLHRTRSTAGQWLANHAGRKHCQVADSKADELPAPKWRHRSFRASCTRSDCAPR
jgi:glycyl-tRNA synthetase beta subunit